jgi:predicted transcriptional regulator
VIQLDTNGFQRQILEEIAKKMVVKKEELVSFLENKVENPSSYVQAVVKALSEHGLIVYVTPLGQSCYAITQKGMREVGK